MAVFEQQPKNPTSGRFETSYTREIADSVCARLASGETLKQIARTPGFPSRVTMALWAVQDVDGFGQRYREAREQLLEHWAEEIVDIADDGSNDWMVREGQKIVNGEVVNRSRLRVDARKWLLAKMAPKKYGDRTAHELSGPDGQPIEHRIDAPAKETREEWLARQVATATGTAISGDSGNMV